MMVAVKQLFSTQHVCVTASVNSKLNECVAFRLWVNECLNNHFGGQYGDIPEEEVQMNNEAIADTDRIMSVYRNGEETIWIITYPGHEVTTVLFPSEY